MTASASTAPAPAVLEFVGADVEPTDAFLDSLVGILWDEADRRIAERDEDQAGDAAKQQLQLGGPA